MLHSFQDVFVFPATDAAFRAVGALVFDDTVGTVARPIDPDGLARLGLQYDPRDADHRYPGFDRRDEGLIGGGLVKNCISTKPYRLRVPLERPSA